MGCAAASEAVPLEIEIADDLRPQEAVDVRRGRDLEARPDFFRDARAADEFAPLHSTSTRLPARARYAAVTRAVVPGANDE